MTPHSSLLLFWQTKADLRLFNMRLLFGFMSLILSGASLSNGKDDGLLFKSGSAITERLAWFTIIEPLIYASHDTNDELKIGKELLNHSPLPLLLWLEFSLHGDPIKVQVTKNPSILHPLFNVESFDNQTERADLIEDTNRGKDCYYSGRMSGDPTSLVAVSVCNGVRGYINYKNAEFLIEPLAETSHSFPHLLYRNRPATSLPLSQRSEPTCIAAKDDSEIDSTIDYEADVDTSHRKKRTNGNPDPNPNPKRYTIEILLVVDRFMVEFHRNTSLKEYVLTMMNMAAEAFHDRSLGKIVDITVAKLIILKEDQQSLKIDHHGDKTLRNFCQWQYSNSWYGGHGNKYVLKYDIAILLTRKDVCVDRNLPCGTIGMAYIGGACRGKRKCAVIEDIGLNTAFTIVHEIGHLLGMTHNEIDNECDSQSGGIPHMMSSQWPEASYMGAMKWSRCSRLKLKAFLRSKRSFCIRGSTVMLQQKHRPQFHEGILPGSHYDANQQCALQFGSLAKHCKIFKKTNKDTELCKHLWCEIDGEDECISNLDPAAQGTECKPGKWCMFGKCIDNSTIPKYVDGGWGEWSNWTECSRSCGIGVSILERKCDNPSPLNGGRYCIGDPKKFRTCNTEPCPEPKKDYRLEQCEMFNNGSFEWIPVHSDTKPCALFCRPAIHGIHLSVQFSPQVVHGTKCWRGSTDICVEGKCEKIGCDNQLNSKIVRDICGVCGGNASSCNLVEGTFTQKKGKGYVTAVVIPEEAKNIIVKEEKPCASYLALKSAYGSFHINGNWKIELPGEYNVDGTIVYYRRSGTQETFYATGPTKVPLHIMVLFQDFNFGVKFQYVMPLNNTVAESKAKLIDVADGSYGWMRRAWSKCSVICGGGIMQRQLECIQVTSSNVTTVDSDFCSGAKPPPHQEKSCNEHKCPITYAVTDWGPCSTTCGLGRKKRTSRCVEQSPDGSWFVQSQNKCKSKPLLVRTCVRRSCYLQWEVSKWTKCSGLCERRGVRYRTTSCPVVDACDVKVKPRVMEACLSPNCTYQWTADDWPDCDASCGEKWLHRNVTCKEQYSNVEVDAKKCKNATRIEFQFLCLGPSKCNVTTEVSPLTSTATRTIRDLTATRPQDSDVSSIIVTSMTQTIGRTRQQTDSTTQFYSIATTLPHSTTGSTRFQIIRTTVLPSNSVRLPTTVSSKMHNRVLSPTTLSTIAADQMYHSTPPETNGSIVKTSPSTQRNFTVTATSTIAATNGNNSANHVNQLKESVAPRQDKSPYPTSSVPCLKNQLRPWACRILADSKYCLEEKNRLRCCLSCKPFIRPIDNML